MAVVYKHFKTTTKELFYVGIGVSEQRAYSYRSRNSLWKNIVNKHGFFVEFEIKNISYNYAKKKEIELIKKYGRLDLKTGILCNMTNGGDGNTCMSKETKLKISNSLKGTKQSEETKSKRKKTLKESWKNQDLRDLKKKQTTELIKKGILKTRLGIPSKRKGIKITEEQKKKTSAGLKKYYENNKQHNYTYLSEHIIKEIKKDYTEGMIKFHLHKKYKLNRKIIDRILCD